MQKETITPLLTGLSHHAGLVTAHAPLDVLDARQPGASVLVSGVAETYGGGLLAPQPSNPLLADTSGPEREFASHQLAQHPACLRCACVLKYPLPACPS